VSLGDRIDAILAPLFPQRALNRSVARWRFQQMRQANYEAAKPSRYRKKTASRGSPDAVMDAAGDDLRAQARYLDENHDLAKGVLDVMVGNIVGTGIRVEPQAKDREGNQLGEFNRQLRALWEEFQRRPEVTRELDLNQAWRIGCRTWLRDGEYLIQQVQGRVPYLEHGSRVPLSLEFMEPDLLPMDLYDEAEGIVQGVEKNAWGQPRRYHLYKEHPGDRFNLRWNFDTKAVPANRMLHPKMAHRFRQTRGVSIFASVMNRLDDIKDYEESERVAARVAAALTGYIKKDGVPAPPAASGTEDGEPRDFNLEPGMVFDGLRPGEDVGTIKSERPNSNLGEFRKSQMQAAAAGTGASYSSVARDYDGSYSSQRQELVEQWGQIYMPLRMTFVAQGPRPVYERFVEMALTAGLVRPPRDADRNTLMDADFRGPAMPWIDPKDEVDAAKGAARAGFTSRHQVIRERGDNPAEVTAEIEKERREAQESQMAFTSDPGNDGSGA
jgi:lambda family phage portal protein